MLNKILIFLTLSVLTGFSQEVFGQHHGGEQAPPISFGSGEVTVFSELFPSDFDPVEDSNTDLRIRFFDTTTGVNIENVSYRVKIFYGNSLVANQMFFDKDGLLEIKIQPKSECDQDELWRCTKYHGENDPVVPNALTSSVFSKPVINGPVFDRSGEYTIEVSIIGAKNPKTQTTEDITFQTKIVIPSTQYFSVMSDDKSYQIEVKNFQEQISDITFDEFSKSLILQVPIDWSHLEHIDYVKNIIEIPKEFPAFKNILGVSGKANDDQISSKALHFDDISNNEVNIIHFSITNDELNKINQNTAGLKLVIKPGTESSKTKKEILFENGYKAKVSHNTKYDQNEESFFAIAFFDKDNNIIPNVRYGYSIKGPDGKETVNTGNNSNLIGIMVPSGSETRYLKLQGSGVYEMKIVLIGVESENFDKFMFQNYNFELSDPEVSDKMVIPNWIKNNAKWWAEGQIDDGSFVQGIQFLIKIGIIKVN